MKSFPKLLRASDAADLREQTTQAIANGFDLYTPLFTDYSGELCQFVVRVGFCLYEYRLIEALDLEDLELQVVNLNALDFDFLFSAVLWNGKYLQWMQRMNESGETIKKAVVATALLDNGTVDPVLRAEELTLVEDVQAGMWLKSVDFSLAAPFLLG